MILITKFIFSVYNIYNLFYIYCIYLIVLTKICASSCGKTMRASVNHNGLKSS